MISIKEASKMRSGIEVAGHITEIKEPRTINLKTGGTLDVRDSTLEDESGKITLTLWGEDGNLVKKGSKVIIKNGYTNEFKGNVSLTKGKFGSIEVVQ